jgi:hypothetical protein
MRNELFEQHIRRRRFISKILCEGIVGGGCTGMKLSILAVQTSFDMWPVYVADNNINKQQLDVIFRSIHWQRENVN